MMMSIFNTANNSDRCKLLFLNFTAAENLKPCVIQIVLELEGSFNFAKQLLTEYASC